MTLPQLARGYLKRRGYPGASIIGATTMAQLEADIAAAPFELDELDAGRDRRLRGPLSEPGRATAMAGLRSNSP